MAKTHIGTVVSLSGDKTIQVRVEYSRIHPLYQKRVTHSKKFATHDEHNDARLGDKVQIALCRPLSKTKRFELTKIIERAVVIEGDAL